LIIKEKIDQANFKNVKSKTSLNTRNHHQRTKMQLTLIIPAFNETHNIDMCLNTIHTIFKDKNNYEVIVIDNASTDDTAAKALKHLKTKTISTSKKISIGKARNLGSINASGEYLAFIDADVLITEKWLTAFEQTAIIQLGNNNKNIIGYPYYLSMEPSWIEESWFKNLDYSNRIYLSGGNIICLKSTFDEVNGFDEKLSTGEDVAFCQRIVQNGGSVILEPNLYTHHEGNPQTLIDFAKREFWHGKGDFESLARFLSSKIALASILNNLLIVLSTYLALANNVTFFYTISTLVVLNYLCVLKRFGTLNLKECAVNTFLHFIYLTSRGLSFLKRG
jgi:glycosyltransferase involved in cell wall biosynthesis